MDEGTFREFLIKMRSLVHKTDMNITQTIETRWKDIKMLLEIRLMQWFGNKIDDKEN